MGAGRAAGRGRDEFGWAGTRGREDLGSGFEGVRVNLFDIFRFGPRERENLGVPKARYGILLRISDYDDLRG